MFNLAFKNFKEDKKRYLLITLLTLISLFAIAVISITSTVFNYLDKSIINHADYRTFFVGYKDGMPEEEAIRIIKKTDHVIDAYNQNYRRFNIRFSIANDDLDGKILLVSNSFGKNVEIIKGTEPQNKYDIVCPNIFYKNGEPDKELTEDDLTTLKLNSQIRGAFTINSHDFLDDKKLTETVDLKISGIYRNDPNTVDENTCYVKNELIEELEKRANVNIYNSESKSDIIMEIDNTKNADYIKKELEKYDMYMGSMIVLNYGAIGIIFTFLGILMIISVLFLFMLSKNIIQKEILESQNTIRLYRAVGYTKNEVIKIMIFKNLFSILSSFIISFIIVIATKIFIANLVKHKPLIFMKIKIIIPVLALILIYAFIIFLFIAILNISKKNAKTKDVLGGN